MNPVDKFVNEFQKIFPSSTIMVTYEEDEVVFYHNAPFEKSMSDGCAIDHLSLELKEAGVVHWFVQMDS